MDNVGFACTTLNPDSAALLKNVGLWESEKMGSVAIALDRKSSAPVALLNYCINFGSAPESQYEQLCPWDSYSRKNIAFIALARGGSGHIFETDDDNELFLDGGQLRELFASAFENTRECRAPNSPNIFKGIYGASETNVWARGFPIRWLDSSEDVSCKEKNWPAADGVGVVQFLVDGNPDVDAILRLVHGNCINWKANVESLPIAVYKMYHPFNSQATLWERSEFPLMYLPSSCDFRMTDIWRGYIAQNALYAKNKCVIFSSPIVFQERNQHVISGDFFGEYSGYAQSATVVKVLSDIGLKKEMSYGEMLRISYRALVSAGIFSRQELVLLDAWLEAIQ